ncbi:MAG TPA: polysaccharide pyruvyl transferase family protein, partial [Vicinamibacterales bacterium]|nr:polysaccharide pyruvyl transferase family protein [Vicinamibacterales bacterium]
MTGAPKRILVVNQHGENRGDEAAMRAMIRAIAGRYPGSSFVVVAQLRDRTLRIPFQREDVSILNMILPVADAAALAAHAAIRAIGLPARLPLPRRARAIRDAYEQADLVITAPGGPYFGDLYAGHELVHWFFVALARLHGKAVFQYAPSCGPFRIGVLNWLRRRFYRWIDVLVVREEISRNHLVELLGGATPVHLAADAAIQDSIPPAERRAYFTGERAHLRDRFLVAATLQRYRFPGSPDPRAKQAAYEQAALACLEHLASVRPAHILFFPQLYGSVHSDVAFHRYIGGRLPAGVSWEVVDPMLDSD